MASGAGTAVASMVAYWFCKVLAGAVDRTACRLVSWRTGVKIAALLRPQRSHLTMSSQPNQSLIDGIRCLQYLVSSDRAIGCRELARLMDINTTRVNRLLMTMASIGLTMQDEHRRYVPGQAFTL